jgi:hypothetical protein
MSGTNNSVTGRHILDGQGFQLHLCGSLNLTIVVRIAVFSAGTQYILILTKKELHFGRGAGTIVW